LKSYHIHITGRVQGVGFRPFIYRMATEKKFNGWVCNSADGVHIELNADEEEAIRNFCEEIKQNSPPQASVENVSFYPVAGENHHSFRINNSEKSETTSIPVTPDFAICADCIKELFDNKNRRFSYPFLTCTRCGPRYSIIRRIPYDRENTSMDSFFMCPECLTEYNDPSDRRFYSQTNSCPVCRIHMSLYNNQGVRITREERDIPDLVIKTILEGKIVAIKGIGGYLLMADASSASAINLLRKRKQRPGKPFALMFPDIASAKHYVEIDEDITGAWNSPESPIVLCNLKQNPNPDLQTGLVAPGLRKIGIMLPYTPLFYLIMNKIRKPLVATSGNLSGSPIIFEDTLALEHLTQFADMVLTNDREILIPQDDSVVQFSKKNGQKIILRRSRGLAPNLNLKLEYLSKEDRILSMGAMLKSTFGMTHNGRLYVSQFLGDSVTLESQEAFENTLNHLGKVLGFSPSVIITDKHPDYPATIRGMELSRSKNARLYSVQHHLAHAYAVLAENGLLETGNILNIVWDGTGFGSDGEIWGGEFFIYEREKMSRIGHFEYYKHLLSDKMSSEPRISALSLSDHADAGQALIENKFSQIEWLNYRSLLKKEKLKTSSVGRIFDGVASMLGLSDFNSYEGESALLLESVASAYYYNNPGFEEFYPFKIIDGLIGIKEMIRGIIKDMEYDKNTGKIASKFHLTLVEIIKESARLRQTGKISFSGGVFQNALLVDLLRSNLSPGSDLYFHRNLSPNDECISAGQIVAYLVEMKKDKKNRIL
jgi:hydrogenase maturation protein HypF